MVIAVPSTESEYVSVQQSLIYLIPLMGLMKEMKMFGFEIFSQEPIVHCKEFEDNSGAIEFMSLPKIRPHTKHINVVFHQFREDELTGSLYE